jgi:hypothetical protein
VQVVQARKEVVMTSPQSVSFFGTKDVFMALPQFVGFG